MLSPSTKVFTKPLEIEYRTPAGNGVHVVRVQLKTQTPKISAFYEAHYTDGLHQSPLGLFLDEAMWYCGDAVRRVRGELEATDEVGTRPSGSETLK